MKGEAYALVETPLGWMAVVVRDTGVRAVYLAERDKETLERRVSGGHPSADRVVADPWGVSGLLARYAAGENVGFRHVPLDLSGATLFQRAVWETTRTIGYGEVRSYGWVAQAMGRPRASRAVGRALGANPVPVLVPCHRVIGADGGLHGFTGGLHLKEALLSCEGHYWVS